MRNRKILRVIAAVLLLMISGHLSVSVSAASGYASQGSSASGKYCQITTSTRAAIIKPFTLTQTEHRQGITTTVGLSHTVTVGCEASTTYETKVGVEFAGVSAEAGMSAGVAVSASYSIGSSVSYTTGESVADGRYRIEAVFPCDYVRIVVGTYSSAGSTIVKDTYIESMPRPDDVYHRLTRYADAVDE